MALELIHDGRIEQSGGEPMNAYDSVFEDGAEADIDGNFAIAVATSNINRRAET